jgi:uncharacterized protein YdaT
MEQFEGFDDELKDLRPEVKEKALELAAGYLKDAVEASVALKKAIAEVEAADCQDGLIVEL